MGKWGVEYNSNRAAAGCCRSIAMWNYVLWHVECLISLNLLILLYDCHTITKLFDLFTRSSNNEQHFFCCVSPRDVFMQNNGRWMQKKGTRVTTTATTTATKNQIKIVKKTLFSIIFCVKLCYERANQKQKTRLRSRSREKKGNRLELDRVGN